MSEESTGLVTPEAVQPAATPENVATPAPETQAAPDVKTEAETKTFTQAELNEIIQREKAKAEAKAERRALKAYRETLERVIPQQQQQPEDTAKDGRPTRSQFADDDDYVEAMADWKLAQREAKEAAIKQQEHQQTVLKKAETIYAEAEKEPGFDRDEFDALPLTRHIAAVVLNSDIPTKLMAYMVKHPDEVARIAQQVPERQAAELGKIEAKLSTPEPPKVSKAPAPIEPIGASKGGSKSPADMTDAEYAKWRRQGRS